MPIYAFRCRMCQKEIERITLSIQDFKRNIDCSCGGVCDLVPSSFLDIWHCLSTKYEDKIEKGEAY